MTERHHHVPPADCPVCGERLTITRLGCAYCGTELSGQFEACPYCALGAQDRRILRTFLVSRGNMKELARDLGVSYPTARARFAGLLVALGLEDAAGSAAGASDTSADHIGGSAAGRPARSTEDILRQLAAGELDIDQADAQLGDL